MSNVSALFDAFVLSNNYNNSGFSPFRSILMSIMRTKKCEAISVIFLCKFLTYSRI
jgi:hypothetical protein